MKETLNYRKADPGDRETLKRIARDVITKNYVPFLGEKLTREFIDSGASDSEIDRGLASCIVLEENTRIIGFAITNNDILHLLMIAPEFQRKGCGTKLLEYTESVMFEKYQTIKLQSFKKNVQAISFYQKNGLVKAGEENPDELDIAVCLFKKSRE